MVSETKEYLRKIYENCDIYSFMGTDNAYFFRAILRNILFK